MPHPWTPDSRYALLHLIQNTGVGRDREVPKNLFWENRMGTGRASGRIICRTDRQTDKAFDLWSLCKAGAGVGQGGQKREGHRQRCSSGWNCRRAQGGQEMAILETSLCGPPSPKPDGRLPTALCPASQLCQGRAHCVCAQMGFFPIQLVGDKQCETPAVPYLLVPPGEAGPK